MITFTEKVYFSENIKERKREKLRKRLSEGKFTYGYFCITYPSNPENVLDIIAASELKYPHYKRNEIKVLGLAKGYEAAQELVRVLIEEIYRNTDGFDIENYYT